MLDKSESPTPDGVREQLIRVTIRLLAEQGPSAIKARTVASAAGLSTMVVYHHFGGIPELTRAVVDYGFKELDDAFSQLPVTEDPIMLDNRPASPTTAKNYTAPGGNIIMIDDFDRACAEEAAHRLLREAEIWRLERAMQENPEDPGTDACDICHLYIMPGDFYVLSDVQGLVCCGCADLNVGDDVTISRMRARRQADDTDDPDEEPPF